MRTKVRKALLRLYRARISERLPQFHVGGKWHGNEFFEWRNEAGVRCIIKPQPSPKWDSFVTEIAWTVHDEYPALGRDDQPRNGGMRFLLGGVIPKELQRREIVLIPGTEGAHERAACILAGLPPEEEIAENVPPAVEREIDLLVAHALPYFESLTPEDAEPSIYLERHPSKRAEPR